MSLPIILSGMLDEFAKRHALGGEPLDGRFEKFANYCLLKTDHYDSFDFDKVSTGTCVGVDGVAVSLSGVIVDDIGDAEKLTSAQFEARFIFSQAKTASSFNLGDFLKFASTVGTFFSSRREDVPAELHKAFEIKEQVYRRAGKLRKPPSVELSYVYTGIFDAGNEVLRRQLDSAVRAIQGSPARFSSVTWQVYDGEKIARLYREAQNDNVVNVLFQRHVSLPPIRGTRSAYLGVMKCADYVEVIKKKNGDLNKGLFIENVRDFLGSQNPVNEDIAKTIRAEARDRFAILNNGVTIVARKVAASGDTFELSQFQVVNGCQTSHVLFNNRDRVDPEMYLTVKLIETSDVDLSGEIIATTNSQTQVTKEAFATIRPYHRVLEDFFSAMRGAAYTYYYERRPHQFDDDPDILQQNIVTAPSLIKSFVSTVLEEPHQVHYYYGTLLSEYNKQNEESQLFADGDHPGLYFAAHHITARTRTLALRDRLLKNWTFHLALLVKRLLAQELKRGQALTDAKFLDVMARVDENFDEAFRYAADFLQARPPTHNDNDNRVEAVTEQMLHDLHVRLGTSPFIRRVKAVAPADVKLKDGRYGGVIERVDAAGKTAFVQTGPFTVPCDATDDVLRLPAGARVTIQVQKGRVAAFKPQL